MVLTLLKKEYERNKLQKKIGEEVRLNSNLIVLLSNAESNMRIRCILICFNSD
jgi:hypothetical protein